MADNEYKYLDNQGLLYFWQKIKAAFVGSVQYDSTNKKITQTKNGATTDIVTLSTLKSAMALNNVANGAEVNQNAFSNVKVGSTTVAADAKTDTIELVAGSNVTLTPDATNDKITIAATDTKDPYSMPYENVSLEATNLGAAFDEAYRNFLPVWDAFAAVGKTYYAECDTPAATAAKVVTTFDDIPDFSLVLGLRITVKFTYTIGVANATMNVNETGAKPIYYNGAALAKNLTDANGTYEFIYNGTQWELLGDLDTNTTYTPASATPKMDGTAAVGTSSKYAREDHVHPSDTSRVPTTRKINGTALSSNASIAYFCDTAAATAAKTLSVSTGYTAYEDTSVFIINFINGGSGSDNVTLNLNGLGAKNVYYEYDGMYSYVHNNQLKPFTPYSVQYLADIEVNNTHVRDSFWINLGDLWGGTRLSTNVVSRTSDFYVPSFANNTSQSAGLVWVTSNPSSTTNSGIPRYTAGQLYSVTPTAGDNTSKVATTSFVNTAINNAIGEISGISYEVVTSLPTTGEVGVIYLIAHSHGTRDAYDEYIWTGTAFEKIGNTDVDLSGYVQASEMSAITNTEIDTIVAS